MESVFGLSPDGVLLWITQAARVLDDNKDVLNSANVFPVADSDTGTNMALTMRASRAEITKLDVSHVSSTTALSAAGRGALLGARGNSGVILAEFITGLAQAAVDQGFAELSPAQQLATALGAAHAGATHAVGNPVDGTILTAGSEAITAAAHAATQVQGHSVISALRAVSGAATDGAIAALERSPRELAVLARSNVLDAGAYGLVLVLASLEQTLGGRELTHALRQDLHAPDVGTEDVSEAVHHGPHELDLLHAHSDIDGEFEVMALVHKQADLTLGPTPVAGGSVLRAGLQELGESVVVVGGSLSDADQDDFLWQCHVHTDVPEQVLNLICGGLQGPGIIAGAEVSQIVIRSLSQQVRQLDAGQGPQVGLVVCIDSPGIAVDLARSGAVVVVRGTHEIRWADIERAALEFAADPIVVSNSDSITAAVPDTFTHVVAGKDDIHVIAAVAAITQELSQSAFFAGPTGGNSSDIDTVMTGTHRDGIASCTPDLQALVDAAEQVIAQVQYVSLEPESNRDLVAALDQLFARPAAPDTIPVVTVLVDQEFPTRFLSDLIVGIESRHREAEVITLTSGKNGSAATVCLEWM